MRIRVIFGLNNKGATVPFHHQYILSDFIESVIGRNNPELADPDLYNFSALKGQTKVGKDGLQFFSSKVTLVLSSHDDKFIETFVRNLFRYPRVEIGRLNLSPLTVEQESLPIVGEEVKFVCLSPIVILDPLDMDQDPKAFINPAMDQFSDILYENTMARMERGGFTAEEIGSFFKFQVVPDKDYLLKIKDEEKKFARVFPAYINTKKYEVRGYTFPFTLYADIKVQQFVFERGLGSVTRNGFGMLDLANTNPNTRTMPYAFPA